MISYLYLLPQRGDCIQKYLSENIFTVVDHLISKLRVDLNLISRGGLETVNATMIPFALPLFTLVDHPHH